MLGRHRMTSPNLIHQQIPLRWNPNETLIHVIRGKLRLYGQNKIKLTR